MEGLLRSKDVHDTIERNDYEIILKSYKKSHFYEPKDKEFYTKLEEMMKEKKP